MCFFLCSVSQLKKTLKMTNIEELQIQSETYYQEVTVEVSANMSSPHENLELPVQSENRSMPCNSTVWLLTEQRSFQAIVERIRYVIGLKV